MLMIASPYQCSSKDSRLSGPRSTDSRVAVEGVILFGQVKHSDRGCARGSDIAQLTFKR